MFDDLLSEALPWHRYLPAYRAKWSGGEPPPPPAAPELSGKPAAPARKTKRGGAKK
jgi:hypothetical protein